LKKIFIISDLGVNVGLGHYSRSLVITKEVTSHFKDKAKIFNFYFRWKNSNNLKIITRPKKILEIFILKKINSYSPDIICFNVSRFLEPELYNFIKLLKLKYSNIRLVAIDGFIKKISFFKKIWIPNILLKNKNDLKNNKILYGWDKIFVSKNIQRRRSEKPINILFTIGGTDKYKLGEKIPLIAEKTFDKNIKLLWVQGPFAPKPKFLDSRRWIIIKNKTNLKTVYKKIDLAFVVFGVSFFEVVSRSIPTVLFFPKKKTEDKHLISQLKKESFDVTSNLESAIKLLNIKITYFKNAQFKAKKLMKKIIFKNRKQLLKEFFIND